jgi:hypothetical protein
VPVGLTAAGVSPRTLFMSGLAPAARGSALLRPKMRHVAERRMSTSGRGTVLSGLGGLERRGTMKPNRKWLRASHARRVALGARGVLRSGPAEALNACSVRDARMAEALVEE